MKNKKIIYTLIIAIIFLFLLTCNSLATFDNSSILEDVLNVIYSIFEYLFGDYYLMYFKDYSIYRVFFIEKDTDLKCYYSTGNVCESKYGSFNGDTRITFNKDVHLVVYAISSDCTLTSVADATDTWFLFNSNEVSYSSISVYTDDTYTDFFFQQPAEQPEGVVQKAVKPVEMKETLAEVVAILPLILSVLVSLIALRKGLQALLSFLKLS